MKSIGKSLNFYLKYFHEMEALYLNEDNGLLESIDASEEVQLKLNKVGDMASYQVADLLFDIAKRIQSIVPATFSTRIGNQRTYVIGYWIIGIWFWPKRRKYSKNKKSRFDINIDQYNGKPSLITAIHVNGGKAKEEKVARILKGQVLARSEDMNNWDSGDVVLGIEDLEPTQSGFNKEDLIKSVVEQIEKIPEKKYKQIFQLF